MQIFFNHFRVVLNVLYIMRPKQRWSFNFNISKFSKLFNDSALRILTFYLPAQILSSEVMTIYFFLHLFGDWLRLDIHGNDSTTDGIHDVETFAWNKVNSSDNLSFLIQYVNNVAIGFLILFVNDFEKDFVVMKSSISIFSLYQ